LGNSQPEVFDDMDGKFNARLRLHQTMTHTSMGRGESISVKSRLGVLEAKFNLEVLERLQKPCFVAIEHKKTTPEPPSYLIYEVTGLSPTHFQMLAVNTALPTVIRKEYLDTIYAGWTQSEETWIDVFCAPTGYMLTLVNGTPVFTKSTMMPLAGAPTHLLSKQATSVFLCVEGGTPIGKIVGFDLDLKVDVDNLVKYHAGVFGFTGSGKSNLTSLLVRQIINALADTTVVVFDVAGEYAVNLADIVATGGVIYSLEELGSPDAFLDSQTLPETLEGRLSDSQLKGWATRLYKEQRVRTLLPTSDDNPFTLRFIIEQLESYPRDKKTGAIQATALSANIRSMASTLKLSLDTGLQALPQKPREQLKNMINEAMTNLNQNSSLYSELSVVQNTLEAPATTPPTSQGPQHVTTPEGLASLTVSADAPPLIIVYAPDPREARAVSSRFINRLLYLKKRGHRRRVTVVLDEAQEFIPYDTRRDDQTLASSLAVEQLLRQGRKYRAHCVLSTQRVAHLNTNALQQLHSYFVGTMPRSYDRIVVAEAFSLNYELLERTTDLDTGQWLFVSFKATKQRNVPVFIEAENNEDTVADWFNYMAP
jgi:hypothetical protein